MKMTGYCNLAVTNVRSKALAAQTKPMCKGDGFMGKGLFLYIIQQKRKTQKKRD